jgi:hypothetical protein
MEGLLQSIKNSQKNLQFLLSLYYPFENQIKFGPRILQFESNLYLNVLQKHFQISTEHLHAATKMLSSLRHISFLLHRLPPFQQDLQLQSLINWLELYKQTIQSQLDAIQAIEKAFRAAPTPK